MTAALVAAGRERDAAGEIYKDGEPGEAMFVVLAGAVELRATRRGDVAPTVLRTARTGDTFGEEALLPGLARRTTAAGAAGTRVAEIASAVARRVLARADEGLAASGPGREGRYLERGAARDVLAASALGRELDAAELELLLDGVTLERFGRGAELVHAGDRAEHVYVVAEGLVQLQRDGSVLAYLARGDFFGDDEALAGAPHAATAVAAGDTWCAVVPRAVVRTITDRNPGVLGRWRRVAAAQLAHQAAVVGEAAAHTTQHVFKDLYRLQIARSLLVIDQDSCVRCGHCAWSCSEVHGESRLVRRGDKVVTPVDRALGLGAGAGAATLLLPNTCQHCRHAACLHDCPTGAIGRDLDGEVFIRADACTGCGNCARSCPWDNISMAPRKASGERGARTALALSRDVAVKCDLCREYAEPACVTACPTGSVLRIDPERDVRDVARVLRGAATAGAATGAATGAAAGTAASAAASVSAGVAEGSGVAGVARQAATAGMVAVAAMVCAAGFALPRAWGWRPGSGAGMVAGVIAGLFVVLLAAYVVPKRFVRVFLRPRDRRERMRPVARSRTKPYLIAHAGLGSIAPAAALAHAGGAMPATTGGALMLTFGLATVLGIAGVSVYRALPRALTRLERGGALPEDLAGDAGELRARLFREMSGTGDLVKRIADRMLVPYARAPLGWVALVACGRRLGDEERAVRARVDRALEGRGADRLAGLDRIIRVAVEIRALPGRRVLSAALRTWLPAHMVLAAMTVSLLAAHVIAVVMTW